jgi:hypothetical protein
MNITPSPTHGGARPGAGRKPKPETVRLPSLRVPAETLAAIEQWRVSHGLARRTDAMRQMLDAAAQTPTR